MFAIRKPSDERIRCWLAAESHRDFSYPQVGATATTTPAGYVVDSTSASLGRGRVLFESAKAALRAWAQFRLGWLEVVPTDRPIESGESVAVIARSLGLWTINSARIVYVVDESGPRWRYGFAYGTLPGHIEKGEERFVVEWRPDNDEVGYSIVAFSRPNHVLARLGYPWVRRMQKRFARDSVAALRRAVGTT
jgi:uncharacterized protein (UPF0548 family)